MTLSDRKKQQQLYSKQSFRYGNKAVDYTLIQSKRRKTCDITVKDDEIILRVPYDKSPTDIEKLLVDKIKWISSKQKEFNQRRIEIIHPTYEDKSTLPYLGTNYELSIITSKTAHNTFELKDSKFIAHIQEKDFLQTTIIKKLYIDWLKISATKIFKDKVDKYSKVVGVNPTGIVIKDLRNRWGSLSKNRTVNLNVNLIKTPDEIIDYIIIHELCHLKITGHSYKFWDYLKQYVPDYPQKIKWLEANANSIFSI